MILPLLAALAAAATAFVTAGAVTGQVATSHRRVLARAERLASERFAEKTGEDPATLFRSDALSGREFIARMLRRFGWARRRAILLDRALIPLKVSEWVLINVVLAVSLGLVATLLSGLWFAGLCFAVAGVVLFEAWIRTRAGRKRTLFEQQLPIALEIMSNGLKSGFGIMESMRTVAKDMDAPISVEFQRVIDEARVGGAFEEAMARMGDRIQSPDLRIVTRALLIHRAVGGDLAEVLDSVGSTMREREALRGHIAALTAQQRLGGVIVGLLPAWVVGFFVVADPEFISPLWNEPMGRLFFGAGIGMEALGFLLMRRILRIEV